MIKNKKKINFAEYPEFLHEYWHDLILVKGKSEGTAEGYFIDIKTFFRYIIYMNTTDDIEFKKIDISNFNINWLENLKLGDIYNYIYFLRDELKNNERTVARKISSIKGMYKYLTKTKSLLKENPTINLEIKTPKRALPKHLSFDQCLLLLEQAIQNSVNPPRDYCIITILLNCGLRLSELVGINISDISFSDKKVRILGKGNKERIVYLNETCINAINEYIKSRENSITDPDALFLSKRGGRISRRRVEQIVNQLMRLSGLGDKGYTVHKLRHTAATLMYQNGVDIRTLKDVLGHESIATTQIYTHLSNEETKRASEQTPFANMKQPIFKNNDEE